MDVIFWICAMVVFLVVEAFTTSLVSIWFALGCLVAGIFAYCGLGDTGCILIFAVISAVSVFVFKKFYNKSFAPKAQPTNADRLIGEKGVVEDSIDPVLSKGTVLVHGRLWSAKSTDEVESGSTVEVTAIEGVKLVVKKV